MDTHMALLSPHHDHNLISPSPARYKQAISFPLVAGHDRQGSHYTRPEWLNRWVLGQNSTALDTKFLDECFDPRSTIFLRSISSNKTKVLSIIQFEYFTIYSSVFNSVSYTDDLLPSIFMSPYTRKF